MQGSSRILLRSTTTSSTSIAMRSSLRATVQRQHVVVVMQQQRQQQQQRCLSVLFCDTRPDDSSINPRNRTSVLTTTTAPASLSSTNMTRTTTTRKRWFASYSRMLDMGGSPGGANDTSSKVFRTVNASKNSKIRAVCFDFDVLTRSVDNDEGATTTAAAVENSSSSTTASPSASSTALRPDTDKIEQIAGLLNVKLGGSANDNEVDDDTADTISFDRKKDDDLSSLLKSATAPTGSKASTTKDETNARFLSKSEQVRAKYAEKLAKRGIAPGTVSGGGGADVVGGGGAGGATVFPYSQQHSKGDAAGLFEARKVVASKISGGSGGSSGGGGGAGTSHWLSQTGTGSLLQYMTQRAINILLLPSPSTSTPIDVVQERMRVFQRQLQSQAILEIVDPPHKQQDNKLFDLTANALVSKAWTQLLSSNAGDKNAAVIAPDHPELIMIVSDRDDVLKAAREMGMVTCRIRPPNKPRGNVTANYTVPNVPEVRQVLDDINGISFNAVLKGK